MLLCISCWMAFSAGNGYCASPPFTDYVTVHNPYNRLPVEGGTFISTGKYYSGYGNYTRHFRVFVPPGASLIDLRVVEATGNVAVARHNIRPLNDTLIPNDPTVQWRERYALSELEQKDCYVYHAGVDTIYILSDYLGGLSIDRAGWLYVNVGGGYVSDYFQIQWHVIIYPSEVPIYNDWWDHYGSGAGGQIDWNADIAPVETYRAVTKPSVTLPPNYASGLAGASEAEWLKDGQKLTVSCPGTSEIYYNVTKSDPACDSNTNCPEPPDPVPPTQEKHDGSVPNGGGLLLNGTFGKYTRFKYRFVGDNAKSSNAETGVLRFALDLTSAKPGAVQAYPVSGKTVYENPLLVTLSCLKAHEIRYKVFDKADSNKIIQDGSIIGPNVNEKVQLSISGESNQNKSYVVKASGYNQNSKLEGDESLFEYTINLEPKPAGDVTVTPEGNGQTVNGQLPLRLSSSNATKIVYEMAAGEKNFPEIDPVVSATSQIAVNGSTGDFTIQYQEGKPYIKIRFAGMNGNMMGNPSKVHTYIIQKSQTPEIPIVNPGSKEFKEPTAKINVESKNATNIECLYNTNGLDPKDITVYRINLSNPGVLQLTGDIGTTKTYKVRFRGYNDQTKEYSALSELYTYTINLSGTTVPGVATFTPNSGTFYSNPPPITLESALATEIQYVYVLTDNEQEPPTDISEPSSAPKPGETKRSIIGSSGKIDINDTTSTGIRVTNNKLYKIRVKAAGKNASGDYGPSGTAYFTVDLRSRPAKPVMQIDGMTISSGKTFITQPLTISVSAEGASEIQVLYTKSEGSVAPQEPSKPYDSSVNPPIGKMILVPSDKGAIVVGISGNGIIVTDKAINNIRLKCAAKSSAGGISEIIDLQFYVDLTPKYGTPVSQDFAKQNPGVEITPYIKNADGLTDPEVKFYNLSAETQTVRAGASLSIADLIKAMLQPDNPAVDVDMESFATAKTLRIHGLGSTDDYKKIYIPLVVDHLFTTDKQDGSEISPIGNLDLTYKNLRISLSPAGWDEDALRDFVKNDYLLAFDDGHVGMLTATSTTTTNNSKIVIRYWPVAVLLGDSSDGMQKKEWDGKPMLQYSDGFVQPIIPYIHKPYEFVSYFNEWLKTQGYETYSTQIDWLSGNIGIKKGKEESIPLWRPEYLLDSSKTSDSAVITIENDMSIFKTKEGSQNLNVLKNP